MEWRNRLMWPVILLGVIWAIQVVNILTGYALNPMFGLQPRAISGLDGIVLSPFLHGSVSHAAANSVPLVILGGLVAASAGRVFVSATAIIVLLGGFAVWVFGGTALHVGASGLIFGWFGFLLARGFVERKLVPIVVALGVGVVYGALLWGVLPGQPGVSWEGHLFGFLAGGFAAFMLRSSR